VKNSLFLKITKYYSVKEKASHAGENPAVITSFQTFIERSGESRGDPDLKAIFKHHGKYSKSRHSFVKIIACNMKRGFLESVQQIHIYFSAYRHDIASREECLQKNNS
jgi:hypothetical protein